MTDTRQVSIRAATGQIRTATHEGREHLVVPVVALMEGVIHAINADVPEMVPLSTLSVAPQSWCGRPVVLGHPSRNGRQISANDPKVLEQQGLGHVFDARIEGTKLLCNAWIDPVKADKIGASGLVSRLRAGEVVEVSVGAFVVTQSKEGDHYGKPYKAVWMQIAPDHLAMLPNGVGACSIAMGCGTRAAEEGSEVMEELTVEDPEPITAIGARHSGSDLSMIQTVHDHAVSLGATCGGEYKAATVHECSCSKGVSDMKADVIKALIANPHSGFTAADEKMLESADEARLVEFQTSADAKAVEVKAIEETKEKALKAVADANEKVTAAEQKLKAAAEHVPTEEEYLQRAPESIRTLVAEKKAQDAATKADLKATLKAATEGIYTDEELDAKPIAELLKLAKMAKVDAPKPDYSGRALPRVAAAANDGDVFTNPPDPYQAGLEAMRKGTIQ